MSSIIDAEPDPAGIDLTEFKAALITEVRNGAIAECQRFIHAHAEMIARADAEAGRHYRDIANLLEVLRT